MWLQPEICSRGIHAAVPELLYLVTCVLSTIPFIFWYDFPVSLVSCLNGSIVSSPDRGVSSGHSSGAFAFSSLVSTILASVLSFVSPTSLSGRRKGSGTECVTLRSVSLSHFLLCYLVSNRPSVGCCCDIADGLRT